MIDILDMLRAKRDEFESVNDFPDDLLAAKIRQFKAREFRAKNVKILEDYKETLANIEWVENQKIGENYSQAQYDKELAQETLDKTTLEDEFPWLLDDKMPNFSMTDEEITDFRIKNYSILRENYYPSMGVQFDLQYDHLWDSRIESIKASLPKA